MWATKCSPWLITIVLPEALVIKKLCSLILSFEHTRVSLQGHADSVPAIMMYLCNTLFTDLQGWRFYYPLYLVLVILYIASANQGGQKKPLLKLGQGGARKRTLPMYFLRWYAQYSHICKIIRTDRRLQTPLVGFSRTGCIGRTHQNPQKCSHVLWPFLKSTLWITWGHPTWHSSIVELEHNMPVLISLKRLPGSLRRCPYRFPSYVCYGGFIFSIVWNLWKKE